MICVEE